MLLSIEGDVSTFKTTFALTAPLPIVSFNFDLGWERAVNGVKFKEYFEGLSIHRERYNPIKLEENKVDATYHQELWYQNDITIYELPRPIQLDSTNHIGYINLWNYFIALFGHAVSSGNISSIVLDTATIARAVKADAYIEELNNKGGQPRKQLLQIEYGHPNTAIENLYTVMDVVGKNFIATHHMRDEYGTQVVRGESVSVPTGRMELDGWNKTHRFVDVAIETLKTPNGSRQAKYIKCGYNVSLEGGLVIGEPNWDSLVTHIESSLEGRMTFPRRKEA